MSGEVLAPITPGVKTLEDLVSTQQKKRGRNLSESLMRVE